LECVKKGYFGFTCNPGYAGRNTLYIAKDFNKIAIEFTLPCIKEITKIMM
jgi:hypothetical protein